MSQGIFPALATALLTLQFSPASARDVKQNDLQGMAAPYADCLKHGAAATSDRHTVLAGCQNMRRAVATVMDAVLILHGVNRIQSREIIEGLLTGDEIEVLGYESPGLLPPNWDAH